MIKKWKGEKKTEYFTYFVKRIFLSAGIRQDKRNTHKII